MKSPSVPFPPQGHDHSGCIADALARAEAHCARHDLRLTPLRRRVLELIWADHRPVRAYDLLARLQQERQGAAPPTVYRALEFLREAGVIHRVDSQNAFIGCIAPEQPHDAELLICRGCGEVAELTEPLVTPQLGRQVDRIGFLPDTQTLEITGLCARCRGKQ